MHHSLKYATGLFFLFIIFTSFSHAQERLKISGQRQMSFSYSAPSWNKNPDEAEKFKVLIRDAITGRLASAELTETEPNSGVFRNRINPIWIESAEITPEIYIIPQTYFESDSKLKEANLLIRENRLLRKPFFLKPDGRTISSFEVFDTKEQAIAAYDQYRKNFSGKPVVDGQALEAQQRAEKLLREQAMRAAEAIKSLQIKKLQEAELLKKQEQLQLQAKLNQEEKERRQKEARGLAQQGVDAFKMADFAKAENLFEKATELDPSNNTFYYQYGVALYKNSKYEKSIAILKIADDRNVNLAEKEYYIGLNHMSLKDNDTALKTFEKVRDQKDPGTSPNAAFLAGVLEFQKEEYDRSKSNFEFVLDNSKDPKLDTQAEAYIEQIANVKAFKAEQAKNVIINLNLGLQYDSNILAISTADQSSATNLAGFRWIYGGSLEYRPVYTEKHVFSGIISISDMYSTDSSFQAETNFQNTDPLTMGISFPYKFKDIIFGKGSQFGATPGYETTQMNLDGEGARETILNSTYLKLDDTLVMTNDWFANYAFEYRSDKSLIDTSATPENNQTATRYILSTSQTFFRNTQKTEAMIFDFAYTNNAAQGDDQKYTKFDLAGTYLMPWIWGTSLTPKLSYYSSKYGSHSEGRADNSYSLAVSLLKPINENWGTLFSANYSSTSSNVEANTYNKYYILGMLTYNGAF